MEEEKKPENKEDFRREISLCLDTGENYKLFHHSAYFCYYSWTHYTFWHYSWVSLYYFSYILPLSIVLSIISFQFQQNKRYLNRPKYYLREEEREWNKKLIFFLKIVATVSCEI